MSKSTAILHAKYASDKVYSLLGVADGLIAEKIRAKVDCKKSLEKIFKEAVVALFQLVDNLKQLIEDISVRLL